MSFHFEIAVDQSTMMLFVKISGFCATVDDYMKYEQTFSLAWQKYFRNTKAKIFIDQRGYMPATREVTEYAIRQRQSLKGKVIAAAIVVEKGLSQMQMQRIIHEADTTQERLFTAYDEALQWLKNQ